MRICKVQESLREQIGRVGHGKGVHHEHEAIRPLGTREGIHVRDVRDGFGEGAGPRDVVRHRELLLVPAATVAGVRRCGLFGVQDERLDGGEIREPVVPVYVAEAEVERRAGRPGGEEVVRVRVPGTVEAGDEGEPGVVVEENAAGLVNRLDGDPLVAGPVPGSVLQVQ
jgi:hypothetical protein